MRERESPNTHIEIDVIIALYSPTAISNSLLECNTKRLINEAHFISNSEQHNNSNKKENGKYV